MLEDNIKKLVIDGEYSSVNTTILQDISGSVFLSLDDITFGDKITLITDNQDLSEEEYKESCYLSANNKLLVKNVVLEAEIEFVQKYLESTQWIEFIVRGVSRWNNSYTIDECYVFGYKNGDFYFAKRGYHEEGERSYSYKQLLDLTAIGDDTRVHYIKFTDSQIKQLQLVEQKLDANTRYLFRCEINEDLVSLKIRNISKKLNQVQDYKWVTVFDGININQTIDDIANVTLDLNNSISIFEPFSTLSEKGMYGYSVPNSHIKMYRFAVENNDNIPVQDLYDDEQFSRKIATDFSIDMNNRENIKFNSVNIGDELSIVTNEILNHEGNLIFTDLPLIKNDIKKIELNNISVTKSDIFNDKNIEFNNKMTAIHDNNKIVAFVDEDQQDSLKQKEIFYQFENETDGVSLEYDIPSEVYDILGKYPNSKIADVLIEIDDNLIMNEFTKVGVKEDLVKFVDTSKLNDLFTQRKCYLETDIRGYNRVIELGTFLNNKHTFVIDDQFTKVSKSYEALWNYNLANFINQLVSDFTYYAEQFLPSGSIENTEDEETEAERIRREYLQGGFSIGEAVVNISEELFNNITESIENGINIITDFSVNNEIDSNIRDHILNGDSLKSIKLYISFISSVNYTHIKNLIKFAKQKNYIFDGVLEEFISIYGGEGYTIYSDFRNLWLRDASYNSVISTTGIENRNLYQSVFTTEYNIEDKKIVFSRRPSIGKKIKIRLFYDVTFLVTPSYDPNIKTYDVPEEVKNLFDHTNAEKGVKQLVEYFNDEKTNHELLEDIPFIIVPKELNPYNQEIFADILTCSPYISNEENVNKYTKASLKKVKDLLVTDFENSKYSEIYPYTSIQTYDEYLTYCVTISADFPSVPVFTTMTTTTSATSAMSATSHTTILTGSSVVTDFIPFLDYNEEGNIYNICFDNKLEWDCLLNNVEANSYTKPLTAFIALENGPTFHEWNREIDLINFSSENKTGIWTDATNDILGSLYYQNIDELGFSRVITKTLYFDQEFHNFITQIELDSYLTATISVSANEDTSNIFNYEYDYEYPRYYPYLEFFPEFNTDVTEFVNREDLIYYKTTVSDVIHTFVENLLGNIADEKYIKDFLQVKNWFNCTDSKLGPFYNKVLRKIIEVMSANSYEGEKQSSPTDVNPLNVNNWLEGFFSGTREPFIDLWGDNIFKYEQEDGKLIKLDQEEIVSRYCISNNIYVKDDNFFIWDSDTYVGSPVDLDYHIGSQVDLEYYLEKINKIFNGIKHTDLVYNENQDPVYFNRDILFTIDLGEDRSAIDFIEWSTSYNSSLVDVYGHDEMDMDLYSLSIELSDKIEGKEKLFTISTGSRVFRQHIEYRYLTFIKSTIDEYSKLFNAYYIIFYTAEGKTLSGLDPRNVHFGRYYGNPWGYECSRKQIIDQLRDVINNKFLDYDLYYADLTKLYYPEKYVELGIKANTWDTSLFPIYRCPLTDPLSDTSIMGLTDTGTYKYLNNPYVDPKLSSYIFNNEIIERGVVVFSNDNFTDVTDVKLAYSEDAFLATTIDSTSINIRGIYKNIKKGFELFWTFNSSYFIKKEVIPYLPIGATISLEYEYTMSDITENNNTPRRISQNIVLGRITGDPSQKFKNPEIIKNKENIEYINIHRLWIDNIPVTDFTINQVENNKYEIDMNLIDIFKGKKDIGYSYKQDNYYDLKNTNNITQTFKNGEYVPWFWTMFTRDTNGYVKKENTFAGFIVDSTKYSNEIVYHLDESISLDNIKTTDKSYSGQLIKPLQYGRDNQDIIQVNSLERRNNFILTFDFIYDADIERELMRFDVMFKGNFTKINGVQQLTDFYSLVFGLDKGISLISRKVTSNGGIDEVVIAQIQDIGAILKRDVFYTVKLKVIKNKIELYFNVRNNEEKFFFSTNLVTGHNIGNQELVAENQFRGLNVIYNDPKYFIDGNKFALKTGTHKINFLNFKIDFLDANNYSFGSPFKVTSYDSIVSNLITKFKLTGSLVSLKKTTTGYEYIQIGNSILARRNGSEFVLHNMLVDKFEVHEGLCYIQEKVSETAPMTVINVYEKGFKSYQNIIVNGKQLANEPLIAFLAIANKKATNIEKIDGKIFITLDTITEIEDDWSNLTATWEEYYAPWNLY